MTLPILNQVIDQQDTHEQQNDLEPIKSQIHLIFAHDPPQNHHERNQQQCDLHARPNSHADGKVHLVFAGDCHGRGVFCRVAHDGKEDQADKGARDAALGVGDGVDTPRHGLGTDRHQRRRHRQREHGNPFTKAGLLGLLLGFPDQVPLRGETACGCRNSGAGCGDCSCHAAFFGVFTCAALFYLSGGCVEHHGVRFELEEDVAAVDDQEEDGGAAGELCYLRFAVFDCFGRGTD